MALIMNAWVSLQRESDVIAAAATQSAPMPASLPGKERRRPGLLATALPSDICRHEGLHFLFNARCLTLWGRSESLSRLRARKVGSIQRGKMVRLS